MNISEMIEIEQKFAVNIEISDESGSTTIYAYRRVPHAGDRLSVELSTMDPPIENVRLIAQTLRSLCDTLDAS